MVRLQYVKNLRFTMGLQITLTSYSTYQERLIALPWTLLLTGQTSPSLIKKKPEFKELLDAINATNEVGTTPLCDMLDILSNLA